MWMQFDVDHPDAMHRWSDAGLPPPSWTACDKRTGRGHAVYGLEYPVRINQIDKQTRLLAAVEQAVSDRLDADPRFAGLITKNPIAKCNEGRDYWNMVAWERGRLYTLSEMLDWVDLPTKTKSKPFKKPRVGIGRNVEVFDLIRFWAYRNFKLFAEEDSWSDAVQRHAEVVSLTADHAVMLGHREVRQIAKSVSKWVWRRRALLTENFSTRQAALGRLGGRPGIGEPWLELSISRASYFRKIASGQITSATLDAFKAHSAHISIGDLD